MSATSPFPAVCTPLPRDKYALKVIDYYLMSDEEKAKLGRVAGRAQPKAGDLKKGKSADAIEV